MIVYIVHDNKVSFSNIFWSKDSKILQGCNFSSHYKASFKNSLSSSPNEKFSSAPTPASQLSVALGSSAYSPFGSGTYFCFFNSSHCG